MAVGKLFKLFVVKFSLREKHNTKE